jgi:hypothetical protein
VWLSGRWERAWRSGKTCERTWKSCAWRLKWKLPATCDGCAIARPHMRRTHVVLLSYPLGCELSSRLREILLNDSIPGQQVHSISTVFTSHARARARAHAAYTRARMHRAQRHARVRTSVRKRTRARARNMRYAALIIQLI